MIIDSGWMWLGDETKRVDVAVGTLRLVIRTRRFVQPETVHVIRE